MAISENLGPSLTEYLSINLPDVRLIRAKERQGLIRARILGADNAVGEVRAPRVMKLVRLNVNLLLHVQTMLGLL